MHKYEDLEVWQVAYQLTLAVYADTRAFPAEERYGLSAQMRRAAVSVISNIAEGAGRATPGEFRNQVSGATGSVLELECQLRLSADLGYMARETVRVRRETCASVTRMLYRLGQSLQA